MTDPRPRILTGDRPTGRLHLGHYVGSLQNRVALQKSHDTILIIADLHLLTTRVDPLDIAAIADNARGLVTDYIGAGIDPEQVTIYLQSAIPEIPQIAHLFQSMVTVNRLQRLPSLKDMARDANIDDENFPFALLGYPVLQSADILAPRANLVPVGKDNAAHVEITREISRRFNHLYGAVLPVPELLLSETSSLVGLDGAGKMSKSRGNCIFLHDDPQTITRKVRSMFTDPKRIRADIPGTVEGNPVFAYHDAFNLQHDQVEEMKARYREGKISDTEIKHALTETLNQFLEPIRNRMREIEQDRGLTDSIIVRGCERMRDLASETLQEMRRVMGITGTWNKLRRAAERRKKQNL